MKESGQTITMIRKSDILGDVSTWMYFTMILLTASMPLSEFGMSISQFLLLGLWVYEGAQFQRYMAIKNPVIRQFRTIGHNLRRKLLEVISNRVLLVFISIYFLHLFALIYTSDLNYGLKDIRVKLPLLSLPVFFATMKPISGRQIIVLLSCFVLSVIIGSFASIYTLLTKTINDPREISIFISHIRFALFISFSIFILIYFTLKNVFDNKLTRILCILGIVWLTVFLFILKSLTGIFITGILSIVLISSFLFKRKAFLVPTIIFLLLVVFGTWFYVKNVFKEITVASEVDWQGIEKHTAIGNPYTHDTITYGIENGTYVGMYISMSELRETWNNRSKIDFDGLDYKNQVLRYTLIRFLHSKGYKKDAIGVNKLTTEEIKQIENGIANANYLNSFNIRIRLDQLLQGYKTYKSENDPNASSFMQRIEYWKTSIWLIDQNPVLGYGTGDVKKAFENAYNINHSRLLPEYRHRSHNQFLAITIASGVIGLIIFMIGIFYPPIVLKKFKNYHYAIFFIIVIFSFLTEDTLETQAGATFFAFFSGLFLFNDKIITEKL